MSGPQDMQGIAKMFGMPGGPAGPRPTMPLGQSAKRLGDSRVPMSGERPQRNPGQIQDQAARKLGVPSYQVQPTGKPPQQAAPPQPQIQAPPPPALPTPMPRSRPADAPLPPEINPSAGKMNMPRSRPPEAGPGRVDPGMMARVATVLGDFLTAQPPPGSPTTFPHIRRGGGDAAPAQAPGEYKPPSTLGNTVIDAITGMFTGNPNKPGMSSAIAAPPPPKSDPFSSGASPIQAGPEQLAQIMAGAQRAKAEQSRPPVQAPEATRPSPNVTPPVPPGQPIPPPPSMRPPQEYTPSQPSFQGYEIRPPKPEKGEAKDRAQPLAKDDNLYYYSRIGVQQDDRSGVAQRIRELREKASDPKTAKNITKEEDRILTQYSDFAKRGGQPGMLKSMEPADVQKRMEEYRSGRLTTQIPDRYQERAPGAEGGPVELKLPPKKKDAAVTKAEDYIDNPPPRNDTDPDKKIVVEDD